MRKSEAEREDSKPEGVRRWGRRKCREGQMFAGYHRLNHAILSHSLLSSELLRASTEKVSYLFYTRGKEGTEVKHLPKVTAPPLQK